MRFDRLLRGAHRVVSHDLPNQLVAIQGLLQLFLLEESDRLSADGREYCQRLQNAAGRAGELVRFLKELDRVTSHEIKVESIPLPDLMREVQSLLSQRRPKWAFAMPNVWHVPTIAGDLQAYVQAFCEVFTIWPDSSGTCLSVQSNSSDVGVELTFTLDVRAAVISPAQTGTPEQGLEWLLAEEWLACSGASMTPVLLGKQSLRIDVKIPNP